MKATQEIKIADIVLSVDYEYYYMEGDYSSEDVEDLTIESIHTEEDISLLFDNYINSNKLYQEIKEKLIPYARDNYNQKD